MSENMVSETCLAVIRFSYGTAYYLDNLCFRPSCIFDNVDATACNWFRLGELCFLTDQGASKTGRSFILHICIGLKNSQTRKEDVKLTEGAAPYCTAKWTSNLPEDGCALCQLACQSRHSETMTILKAQSQCNCDCGLMHAADDRLKTPAPDIVFGSLSLP